MDSHQWDERYAASEMVWSRGPNEFVRRECEGLPAGRAVDLAAGEGRNALWLASRGWRATAVDFSQVALDKGARLAGAAGIDVEWVCADATAWTAPEPVDLVVMAYFQVPAADRRRAHRNAWSMLRPSGTLVVVAHDTTNLTDGVGGPQDARVLMTAADVLADLDGLAIDVQHADRVERRVEVDDGHRHQESSHRTAYDALVRVTRLS